MNKALYSLRYVVRMRRLGYILVNRVYTIVRSNWMIPVNGDEPGLKPKTLKVSFNKPFGTSVKTIYSVHKNISKSAHTKHNGECTAPYSVPDDCSWTISTNGHEPGLKLTAVENAIFWKSYSQWFAFAFRDVTSTKLIKNRFRVKIHPVLDGFEPGSLELRKLTTPYAISQHMIICSYHEILFSFIGKNCELYICHT